MNTTATPQAQMDIFDAVRLAAEHATDGWLDAATRIVRRLCETQETFTADDVLNELDKTMWITHDLRALGSVMIEAKKSGVCKSTGVYVPSARKNRHRRPIVIWQSLLPPSA